MKNIEFLGWNKFFTENLERDNLNNFDIARIISQHRNGFIIKSDTGEDRAVSPGKLFYNASSKEDLPVVGDWVLLKKGSANPAIIEKIIPRKTTLCRKLPNDRTEALGNQQIIASNIDTVFIVASLNQDFNLSRIERTLALVYNSGASPVILLSKSDLCDNTEQKLNSVTEIAFGVPIIDFSNVTGNGIDEIKKFIQPQKTYCLLGSSGVGKTSLMNILCNKNEKTAEIRESDDRGRHATTARNLYFLENGAMVIDTPGIREVGIIEFGDNTENFSDIEELAIHCKFTNCTHTNEPGCTITSALVDGTLNKRRFQNWIKLKTEAQFQADKEVALKNKKDKFKKIAKLNKQMKK